MECWWSMGVAGPGGAAGEAEPWWSSCSAQQESIEDYIWEVPVAKRRRQWHPTPVLLPGKSHGWRSLEGCSPWGRWGSDTTERLHFHFHALEKEMATHSSVLALRIPGTADPGRLPSMRPHRVGHDWSDLAAAAAVAKSPRSQCRKPGELDPAVQSSSVAQCPTLCSPMDCIMPGLPVHHQLPEFTQTHVHWIGDAIQPSHPLSSPSPPAFNLSWHQGLFQWVTSSPSGCQSCHLFLASSSSVKSIPFLFFIVPIFAWNVPLVSLIFLKRSLVFPFLLFPSISLCWSPRKTFLSLLAILWNSAFKWVYLSFSPLPSATLLFSAIWKASSDNHFAFLHFFSFSFLDLCLCTMSWTSIYSSSSTLSDLIPWIYLSLPLYNQS